MFTTLISGYSSVKEKQPLSIKDNSIRANAARAGVIDVLVYGVDPTGGATYWDGTDFIAWGLCSPNGKPQNKFKEYNNIFIQWDIYKEYINNTLSLYPKGKVRYSGKYYMIPSAVFIDKKNWKNGNFTYKTRSKSDFRIEATGAVGGTIFWKRIK